MFDDRVHHAEDGSPVVDKQRRARQEQFSEAGASGESPNLVRLSPPTTLGRLALVLLAVVGVGCAVTLISSYDQETDKGVTELHKEVGGLLNQLEQTPVPVYSTVKKTYESISSNFASLLLRNQARAKNTKTVKQLDALKANLDILEKQHKDGTLNQAMVPIARSTIDQTFAAILKLELAKKALDEKE